MKRVGNQELTLLAFVAERGGATVGEVAMEFGAPRGLSRTTVLTMMERLRQKRRLTRRRVGGVFRYVSPSSRTDVLRDAVKSFVDRALGGSVSPFAAYLTQSTDLTDDEVRDLEKALAQLKQRRKR